MQIRTNPPTHHSICTNARRKYLHPGWENDMFQLSSLSLANKHLSCIHLLKTVWIWRLKVTKVVLGQKIQRKIGVFRCTYYFSLCNLPSQPFSTHPPSPICMLCKLDKPCAKMDDPLDSYDFLSYWSSLILKTLGNEAVQDELVHMWLVFLVFCDLTQYWYAFQLYLCG